MKQVQDAAPTAQQLEPAISPELEAVVKRALAKDPSQR